MKQQPDANATIQLDRALEQLEGIQLDELDAASSPSAPPQVGARLTPPPLPLSFAPSAPAPTLHSGSPVAPGSPSVAPSLERGFERAKAPSSAGKTAALAVMFIALLGVAIAGGWKVAVALRPAPPPPPAQVVEVAPAAAPATDPAASAAPAQAAPAVLNIPTIEMNDMPAETPEKNGKK